MRVKVIIFDLDDTLFDEIEYVKSGFKYVSNYFSNYYNLNSNSIYDFMIKDLEINGRGKIFDNMLNFFDIYSKKKVIDSIRLYRTHKPNIILPSYSIDILKYLNKKKIPMYIITDGNKIVQSNKIEALKLTKYIKKEFITHRYGIKHSKPSTYCFEKIAKLENVNFYEMLYIGDNPNKDFINIKKLGFRTIRILQGMFKDIQKTKEYEAEINISNLIELKNIINEME